MRRSVPRPRRRRFLTVTRRRGQNRILADSLSGVWNYIFDNKNYAYGYLLDRLGQEQALVREEEALSKAMRQLAAVRGETASDAVADYFLRKRVLVDYERSVADVLGLEAASDSLRGVAGQLGAIDFRLPKVEVHERFDFDSVTFHQDAEIQLQESHSRVPGLRGARYDLPYPAGERSTPSVPADIPGSPPALLSGKRRGQVVLLHGGFCHARGGRFGAGRAPQARVRAPREIVVWTDGAYRNLRVTRGAADCLPGRNHRYGGTARTLSRPLSPRRPRVRTLARGTAVVRGGMPDDKAVADRAGCRNNTGRPVFENKSRRNCGIIEFIAHL